MPQMGLYFDEGEYALIPEPKRTWVMRVIRDALNGATPESGGVPEREWAFKVFRNWTLMVLRGFGSSPAAAARSLGLPEDPTMEYRTIEGATAEGWFNVDNPLDV